MATLIDFPGSAAKSKTSNFFATIREIPIIQGALYFLSEVSEPGGINLTAKGNLSRIFVQKFWSEFVNQDRFPFKPTGEEDCLDLMRISFLLQELGYIRRIKKAAVITDKGRSALEAGATPGLYCALFGACMFTWNWGIGDRYPDHKFIQDDCGAMINTLWGDNKQLAIGAIDLFVKSFSFVNKETGAVSDVSAKLRQEAALELSGFGEVTIMVRCMQLRFMERFCVPFGILKAPATSSVGYEIDLKFEKTEFLLFDLHELICPLIHGQTPN